VSFTAKLAKLAEFGCKVCKSQPEHACERSGSGLKCRSTLHQFIGLPLTAPFSLLDLPPPLFLTSPSPQLFLKRNCVRSSPTLLLQHEQLNIIHTQCRMQPLIIRPPGASICVKHWGGPIPYLPTRIPFSSFLLSLPPFSSFPLSPLLLPSLPFLSPPPPLGSGG
jgi:hypothetical protein